MYSSHTSKTIGRNCLQHWSGAWCNLWFTSCHAGLIWNHGDIWNVDLSGTRCFSFTFRMQEYRFTSMPPNIWWYIPTWSNIFQISKCYHNYLTFPTESQMITRFWKWWISSGLHADTFHIELIKCLICFACNKTTSTAFSMLFAICQIRHFSIESIFFSSTRQI